MLHSMSEASQEEQGRIHGLPQQKYNLSPMCNTNTRPLRVRQKPKDSQIIQSVCGQVGIIVISYHPRQVGSSRGRVWVYDDGSDFKLVIKKAIKAIQLWGLGAFYLKSKSNKYIHTVVHERIMAGCRSSLSTTPYTVQSIDICWLLNEWMKK